MAKIGKVGVLGAGTMGSGIAQVFAQAGTPVCMVDSFPGALDRARAGMACLVVSSDLPEVLALADRILVMREGRIRGELSGASATEEAVMQLATHQDEAVA